MKAEFIHSLYIAIIYLGMFGIGEILFHFFHVRVEISRKFSHLSAGIIAFLFPLLITHHMLVLILAVGFTGLLIITKKTNLLKSIHSVKRVTFGSYLYPWSIYVCFLLYSYYDNLLFYFLPLEGVLFGTGISKGIVEGKALVVLEPDIGLEVDGNILITRMTDPGWIFLMSKAKGLISEKGSILSHTAIIGRELGIPMIIKVTEATRKIKSENVIRIDGSKGTVTFLEYDHIQK